MDKSIISIVCTVYNHEKYLRKCLDGFIMQKTSFKFEAIVHDDASTDHSAQIIQEYAEKYPDIIKPIYQRENQYSKGIGIMNTHILPKAEGKYLAFCEGDDWWSDVNKLQKQYDYMNQHPECSICVHQAIKNEIKRGTNSRMTNCNVERDFTTDEIILGGGALFATNSILCKREVCENMPKCFYAKSFGDFQLVAYGSICGTCHYLAETMSVYNCGTENSWTEHNSSTERIIKIKKEMITVLRQVDLYYPKRYPAVNKKILQEEYCIACMENDKKKMKEKQYRKLYRHDQIEKYLKMPLRKRFPQLLEIKRRYFAPHSCDT